MKKILSFDRIRIIMFDFKLLKKQEARIRQFVAKKSQFQFQ